MYCDPLAIGLGRASSRHKCDKSHKESYSRPMPDPALPALLARAHQHAGRPAIIDSTGRYTYDALLRSSWQVAAALLDGGDELRQERVAFLITPGYSWVAVLWGIWRAGGIAAPLPLGAPADELEYILDDTQAAAVVFDDANEKLLRALSARRHSRAYSWGKMLAYVAASALPAIRGERRAMILYTSGTTSRPKGAVTTHANNTAQIMSLVEAWGWSADDRIPLCLPLHHVHGIINIVSCALWSGAMCRMLPRFDADTVWDCIADG